MANDNRDRTMGIYSRLMPWLQIAVVALLAYVCMRAEARSKWYLAQGTFLGILFLLGVAGLDWWRREKERRPIRPELAALHQALKYLLLAFAIGIIAVMTVAVGQERWQRGIVAKSMGTGILFAGGTFAIGMLLGFLFGFPPALSATTPSPTTPSSGEPAASQGTPAASGTASAPSSSFFQNTNLREISDWLTKVIVGAGLVDLTRLPPQVTKLAWAMAYYTDPTDAVHPPFAVALAIMAYFSSCGVLFGYVWTRFEFLASSLPSDHDAEAFERVDRWLKQPPGPKDDDDRAAMTNAIKAASAGAQMRILLDAEQYRFAGTEDANARSLPVFQALVEADPHEAFHRNRGQYALALMARKKQDAEGAKADCKRALDLLNDAIRIRERSHEPNWHQYEFARAGCRIHLDEQFNQQQKSTPEAQASIRADLDKASDVSEIQKKLIDPDAVATKWGTLNP